MMKPILILVGLFIIILVCISPAWSDDARLAALNQTLEDIRLTRADLQKELEQLSAQTEPNAIQRRQNILLDREQLTIEEKKCLLEIEKVGLESLDKDDTDSSKKRLEAIAREQELLNQEMDSIYHKQTLDAARRKVEDAKRPGSGVSDSDYLTLLGNYSALKMQSTSVELADAEQRLDQQGTGLDFSAVNHALAIAGEIADQLEESVGNSKTSDPEAADLVADALHLLSKIHAQLSERLKTETDKTIKKAIQQKLIRLLQIRLRLLELQRHNTKVEDQGAIETDIRQTRNELMLRSPIQVSFNAKLNLLSGNLTATHNDTNTSGTLRLKSFRTAHDLEVAWKAYLDTMFQIQDDWPLEDIATYMSRSGLTLQGIMEKQVIFFMELAGEMSVEEKKICDAIYDRRVNEINPMIVKEAELEAKMAELNKHFAINYKKVRKTSAQDTDAVFRSWNCYWLYQNTKDKLIKLQKKLGEARDKNSALREKIKKNIFARSSRLARTLNISLTLKRVGKEESLTVSMHKLKTKEEIMDIKTRVQKKLFSNIEYMAWVASTKARFDSFDKRPAMTPQQSLDLDKALKKIRQKEGYDANRVRKLLHEQMERMNVDSDIREKTLQQIMKPSGR